MQVSSEGSEKDPLVGQALLSFARNRHIEQDLIARLMSEHEPFREVCSDYEECCGKLLSLEKKGAAADRQLLDYREMRDQLERDLERHLEGAAKRLECGRRAERT